MTRIQKIMAVAIVALLGLTAKPAVAGSCVTAPSLKIGNVTFSCEEGPITACSVDDSPGCWDLYCEGDDQGQYCTSQT